MKIRFSALSGAVKVWILFSAISIVTVISFQNCGKAGFDNGLSAGDLNSAGAVDPTYNSAPMPIEVNVNTVGYMSCPKAGENSNLNFGDPLSSPYYTFRVGAFDNNELPLSPAGSANRAGIGMTSESVNFAKTLGGDNNKTIIRDYVQGSKYTVDKKAVVALISQNRTNDFYTFTPLAATLTDQLSLKEIANSVAIGSTNSSGTIEKVFYVPTLEGNRNQVLASLNFGNGENSANKLRTQMNNHYLHIGFADTSKTDSATDITRGLEGPDSDVAKRLYGRALRVAFRSKTSNQWPFLTTIREFSLNPSNYSSGPVIPEDLTSKENQTWSACFSLMIVREVDRKYFIDSKGSIVNKRLIRKGTSGAAATEYQLISNYERAMVEKKMYKLYSADPQNPIPSGVFHKACPSMNPALLDPNSQAYDASTAEKYMVARRFLPARFWDINTENGYDCIVPKKESLSGYQCYDSGDDDPDKYIAYPADLSLGDPVLPCGATGVANECAAFASFCYRIQ
jgi:hypothetical protein